MHRKTEAQEIMKSEKPKNAAAQALAEMRKPENMARSPEVCRRAAKARWAKRAALKGAGL